MKILLPISLDRWRNPIATLLRACVTENPDIEFFSYSRPASEEDRKLGEKFWALPNIVSFSQPKLATTRFDLVHTASISWRNLAAVVAAKCRSRCRCSYLATINLEVGPEDGKDWTLLQVAEELADGFVSVSKAAGVGVAERCADRFLEMIPNGFDAEYFDPNVADEDILPEAVRALVPGSFALYVGALEPRKHPEFIFELARRQPDVIFVAAGYVHPDGRNFEPLMHSLTNLKWLGHVDRRCIRALMRHAGVFLFPSEREGLALSVIEALGMGLPVIGQPKSSMPELIENDFNGNLYDICEVDQWMNSMMNYLSRDEQQRQEHRNHIRPGIVNRYSWSNIGRKYSKIYRQLYR